MDMEAFYELWLKKSFKKKKPMDHFDRLLFLEIIDIVVL